MLKMNVTIPTRSILSTKAPVACCQALMSPEARPGESEEVPAVKVMVAAMKNEL